LRLAPPLVDLEDHLLLDPEVDALQLEVQAVDVLQQVQEVVVHQLEAQVVEVLQQEAREVDVLQLEAQAVEVLQWVVREVDVPQLEDREAVVEVLLWVGLEATCASVWTRR